MFKVRNISNGKITLGDLNLIIDAGAEIDLDIRHTRERLESSQTLHRCLQPEEKKLVLVYKDPSMGKFSLQEIENHIKAQVDEQLKMQPMPQNVDNATINDLKKQIDVLIGLVANQRQNVPLVAPTSTAVPISVDDEKDNQRTLDIQEKLIKRLSKNVESKVDSKEEISESNVSDRASELEDLI